MTTLEKKLQAHALAFANSIVAALKGARIDELVSMRREGGTPTGRTAPVRTRKGGRLARRSVDDITTTIDAIVALVKKHPQGLRSEEIRATLGLDRRELPRPLADGLRSGALTKKGEKRATIYLPGKRVAK